MTKTREIQIFVASPDDVDHERKRLEGVAARLNSRYGPAVRFHAVRWETRFYKAHETFQKQIAEPANCDVVIVIFGNKLGSELPEDFEKRLPDGTPYPSGTAYELLSSIAAAEMYDQPAVYVFRKTTGPQFGISQLAEHERAIGEKERLDAFFNQWFRTPAGGFKRAFQLFEQPDDFEVKVDESLRQWAGLSLQTEPDWKPERDGSPFRGLEPFDASHSRVFFGRDRKARRAIDELVRAKQREGGRPFLLVVGASGSGKSSLVRAGVIPRLTAPGVIPEVDRWRVAVVRPGASDTPFTALSNALYVNAKRPKNTTETVLSEIDRGGFGSALPELDLGSFKTPQQLADMLEEAPRSAAAPVVDALDRVGDQARQNESFSRPVRTDLLLLIDQLEEIFATNIADAQRAAFGRVLTILADSGRVWIVATLRADLYVRMLDQTLPFLALKDTGGSYDLASPGEAELAEILRRSAEVVGLEYELDKVTNERLDEWLLRDATGADTLPLLQFSLQELYEQKAVVHTDDGPRLSFTIAAYNSLGGTDSKGVTRSGIDGAINKVAEDKTTELRLAMGERDFDDALSRLLRRLAVPVQDKGSPITEQTSLTARAVRLEDVTPDERSRKLVEGLVKARLLVATATAPRRAQDLAPMDAERPPPSPTLRLAHERVLKSWVRAAGLVAIHIDYFHVRADVEIEEQRWINGKQRHEYLLSGAALEEARQVVRDYRDELPEPLVTFINASWRRERLKQQGMVGLLAVLAVVAVVTSAFGVLAYSAEQKAVANYAAAKGGADHLVSAIAVQLRTQKQISIPTLDIVFGVVEDLINKIEDQARSKENAVARQLQTGFAAMQSAIGGTALPSDMVADLDHTRATMLFEFAKTYHLAANDLTRARENAAESLAIRQKLLAGGDLSAQMRGGIAVDQMELGDLTRASIEGSKPPGKDFSAARAFYDPARMVLKQLVAEEPGKTEWARSYSQTLTKLGDLELKDRHFDAASGFYKEMQNVTLPIFRASPNDTDTINEMAWSYRKVGDIETEKHAYRQAVAAYSQELCVRHHLVVLDPNGRLSGTGLGYSLLKLGDSRMKLDPPDTAGAGDAYFWALQHRLETVQNDNAEKPLYELLILALQRVADYQRTIDEPVIGDIFAAAADDIRRRLPQLFLAPADIPKDQTLAMFLHREEQRLRDNGVFALIDPYRQPTIESKALEFKMNRLPELQQDAAVCWQSLVRSVMPAPIKQASVP